MELPTTDQPVGSSPFARRKAMSFKSGNSGLFDKMLPPSYKLMRDIIRAEIGLVSWVFFYCSGANSAFYVGCIL